MILVHIGLIRPHTLALAISILTTLLYLSLHIPLSILHHIVALLEGFMALPWSKLDTYALTCGPGGRLAKLCTVTLSLSVHGDLVGQLDAPLAASVHSAYGALRLLRWTLTARFSD